MAHTRHLSSRGRAALLILATGGTVLGAGALRSVLPAAALSAVPVTITASPTSVVTGNTVDLVARVGSHAGPTGTVTFLFNGTPIPSGSIKTLTGSKNSASTSMVMSSPGAYTFTARYGGSSVYAAATSPGVVVNVGSAGASHTAVSLTSSIGNSIPGGSSLVIGVTLGGNPVPTGSVKLLDNGSALADARSLVNGATSFSISGLALGENDVVASYSGDPTYAPATGELTITVVPTANDNYVEALYRDLIGSVDPDGEAYWASQLDKGASRYNVAYGFTTSEQFVSTLVANLYQNEMGRAADASGLSFWIGQIRNGIDTPNQVAASLVGSNEMFADPSFGNNDVTTYITAVYQALLGRAPDASGLAYWQNFLLTGGPRWQMTLDFASGPEWAGIMVDRFYQEFLGAPNAGSATSYWANQLLHGMSDFQLVANLTSSPQFYSSAQSG